MHLQRKYGLSLAAIIAAAAFGSPSAQAQALSLNDQKTVADTEKARVDAQKASIDAQLAVAKQLQSITGGAGDLSGAEVSAEGTLLIHHVYDGAATRLAEKVVNAGAPPVVVFGGTPPTLADLRGFEYAIQRLRQNLDDANEIWAQAEAAEKKRADEKDTKMAIVGPLTTIAMIASVADLFTVDTVAKGALATAKDEQFEIQLARALAERGVAVDLTAYEVADEPRYVLDALGGEMEAAYRRARRSYLARYMPLFLQAGGKLAEKRPDLAAAGKNLETAIADYEAARKTLLTPLAGVMPATVIERQRRLATNIGSRPILYIRSHRAALTTTTKKGFFVGWSKPPIYLSSAVVVDYVLVRGGVPEAGSLSCITENMHFTKIAALSPKKETGLRDAVCATDTVS